MRCMHSVPSPATETVLMINRILGVSMGMLLWGMAVASAQPVMQSLGSLCSSFSEQGNCARMRFSSFSPVQLVRPVYPEACLREKVEGCLEIKMYVNRSGRVEKAEISVSSGNALLDRAALESAKASRFPQDYATIDGIGSDFTTLVPYYFLLSADPEQYWHTRLEMARIEQQYDAGMREFQPQLKTGKSRLSPRAKKLCTELEKLVAQTKRLQNILASKKEAAINRLRDQLALGMNKEKGSLATVDAAPQPELALPGYNVVTSAPAGLEAMPVSLEQISEELELKRAYL